MIQAAFLLLFTFLALLVQQGEIGPAWFGVPVMFYGLLCISDLV